MTHDSRSGWSDARVRRLEQLWRDGQSASQVARILGVTRNAVIGKVHRLGLSKDGRHAATRVPPKPRRVRPPPHLKRPQRDSRAPAAASDTGPPLPGLVPRLEQLAARACHWPIGDPRQDDFAFCGRAADGGPYCTAHAGVAFVRRAGRR